MGDHIQGSKSKNSGQLRGISTFDNHDTGHQFNALGGTQINNSGSGTSFARPNFHGPVQFGHNFGSHKTPLQECLKSLAFPEMDSRFEDIKEAADGTCKWLFQNETYKKWSSCHKGLLWIKGKPGSGKSTSLRYALDGLMDKVKNGDAAFVLSFFFHGRGIELQKTQLGLFRSLLHQVLGQAPNALSDLVETFETKCKNMGEPGEKWQWHPNELWRYFRSSLCKVLESRSVWLFIDALDECGEKNAVSLIKEFNSLVRRLPSTKFQFRICFACRNYPIFIGDCGFEIYVDVENEKDISTYVRAQLSSSGLMKSKIPVLIEDGAKGVFLWVRLVVDQVLDLDKNGNTLKEIEKELRSVPPELDELYCKLIEDMKTRSSSLKLIQWICFATRPLSLDELRWAMVLDSDCAYKSLRECQSAVDYVADNGTMEKRLKTFSCGLAETVLSSKARVVQFIHQSVKDFFVEKGLLALNPAWDPPIGRAHYRLSRSCIRYLAMEEIVQLVIFDGDNLTVEFPLLHYTTTSWVTHVKQSESENVSQTDLINYFAWPSELLVQAWARIYCKIDRSSDNCRTEKTNLLHILSGYGIMQPLRVILKNADLLGNSIDAKDSCDQTPLLWAARNGQEAVVKLLLETGQVDIDSKDISGRTPLSWAAKKGHEAVVKLLLEKGADLESKDNNRGRTPLSWAAENGHEAVVKLLLEKGADLESKDKVGGRTPLSWAAKNGHEAVVKLLLEKGADLESKDNNRGQTPLSWAAENGHEAVIKLLLEKGADLESKDNRSRTPLWWAAENRREAVVKLLLEKGADVGLKTRTIP